MNKTTYDSRKQVTSADFKKHYDNFPRSVINMYKMLTSDQITDLEKGKKYQYIINKKAYIVIDGKTTKIAMGEDYNFVFDKTNGNFNRWGKNFKDDPQFSPIGPEIADIEITTICSGCLSKNKDKNGKFIRKSCSFCYKSNTPNGINMSFETFKKSIDKLPKTLTQVAFGIDSTATSNPDLWKMADYCRQIGIIPNVTIADISDDIADKLANVMGAVAVSRYENKDACYDTVQKLVKRGMKQVNIHYMISTESFKGCIETINDMTTDKRLKGINALVMLSLKKKGRGVSFHSLSSKQYNTLVNLALEKKIGFGFDSCGCKKFFDAIKDHADYDHFKQVGEPCESTLFSWYMGADAKCYPCSFCDNTEGWKKGINVINNKDFLNDIWYNKRMEIFRKRLINNCNNRHKARECFIYDI